MFSAGNSEGGLKTASSYLGLTLGDGAGREGTQVEAPCKNPDLSHAGCFSPSMAVSEQLTTILDDGVLILYLINNYQVTVFL